MDNALQAFEKSAKILDEWNNDDTEILKSCTSENYPKIKKEFFDVGSVNRCMEDFLIAQPDSSESTLVDENIQQ